VSPADPRSAGTVIFDLDTTLVLDMDHALDSFRVAAAEVAPRDPEVLADAAIGAARDLWRSSEHVALGKSLGIASWEVLWADFDGCHPSLEPMRTWAPEFRLRVWEQALTACGSEPTEPGAAARAFVAAQRRPHPLVPGGVEALRAVAAAGRTVAILTNGPPDIQRHKLSQLDCDELLAAVVISGELGIGKPAPEAFAHVLDLAGAEPADSVMVGDSWNRDVEGARDLGMAAVWLSFGRPEPRPDWDGVTVVPESERLVSILGC
jgi:HAD superfamily hydrolase (TIGR01509 family)